MTERKKWPDDYDAPDAGLGVRCPKCGCKRSRVTHVRPAPGAAKWRRRVCGNCGRVWSTYER